MFGHFQRNTQILDLIRSLAGEESDKSGITDDSRPNGSTSEIRSTPRASNAFQPQRCGWISMIENPIRIHSALGLNNVISFPQCGQAIVWPTPCAGNSMLISQLLQGHLI